MKFKEVEREILKQILLRCKSKIDGEQRAGDHRICNSCWRFSRNCNSCNCRLSSKTSRALGRNSKWNEFTIKNVKGQATVEFALIAFVLIVIVVGLGALLRQMNLGVLLDHAIVASSHTITHSIGGVLDALVY